MNFKNFDTRHYETAGVREGYAEWAATYEDTVVDLMDLDLLARMETVPWSATGRAMDLACGTGRIGVWLRSAGVTAIDGHDLTPEMLARAEAKGVYDQLTLGDIGATGHPAATYDLVTASLVDEHLPTLAPMYAEAARLLRPGGLFVLIGYHPHFLLLGIPTHFDRASGEPLALECHVHLTSDHVAAAHATGFRLAEMHESVVDARWAAAKPKWRAKHDGRPITFAFAWERTVIA